MIYRYGSYSHANNEVEVQIAQRGIRSARGFVQFIRHTHEITGKLQAANQAALTAAINSLKTAYSTDGLNAGLYLDDGATATSHVLISALAIGGVRVVAGPNFPAGTGAEYSTFRTYRITLQADYPNTNAELLEWEEIAVVCGNDGGTVRVSRRARRPAAKAVCLAIFHAADRTGGDGSRRDDVAHSVGADLARSRTSGTAQHHAPRAAPHRHRSVRVSNQLAIQF